MKKALMTAHVAYAIELFNIPNIKLLQEMGYEVQVACNFDDRSSLSDEKVTALKNKLDSMGVKYYNIPFQRNPLKPQNIKAFTLLRSIIDKENFSLIHCHTPVGGIITRLAAAKLRYKNGTKVIYTAHGFHFFKGAPIINWLIYFTAEKFCSYFTDTLITINKEDFSLAKKRMNAKNVRYVPGVGVDAAKLSSADGDRKALLNEINAEEDSVIFLSIGELSDRKNHSVSIKALAELQNPKAHLLIAGTGEKRADLENLSAASGVKDNVHFLGFRTDIPYLLNSADIFLFPSLQEGLPVALMEAMACSKPVICSEIRGNTDLIDEKSGILCPATDENAFKNGMERLIKDKTLRQSMGKLNKEKIKDYDIAIIKKHMEEIYGL